MDAQALLTPDAIDRYMGVPLAHVPAPAGSPHPNYARHFAGLFLDTFATLGIKPRVYWMSEQYASGAMDTYIERALDNAAVILEIYRTVSSVIHPSDWLPISVICENCGRSGTTRAFDWSTGQVSYECRVDLVAWAKGCGYHGRTSPFGGRAKLVWNVDWAARWGLVGVTIEGCGKDLATAGGSRDRADAISRRVFEREPPLNVPYEFLNIGGRKMSTSKGYGAAAHQHGRPPAARDPALPLPALPSPTTRSTSTRRGTRCPRLFDEFDRCAEAVAGRQVRGELPPNVERIFALSLADDATEPAVAAAMFRPSFAHLALLLQVPGPSIEERMAAEKGAPLSAAERAILEQRVAAAEVWLEDFAPDTARLAVAYDAPPPAISELDAGQRHFLASLEEAASATLPVSGEGWQALVFQVARERELPAGQAFGALYRAFLGRSNGPRAGWLLASLPTDFALHRLQEAATGAGAPTI